MLRIHKKKQTFLSRAFAVSLLLGTASCAQMQGIEQGVPIGSSSVASFTSSQGQQIDIMQPPGTSQYDLYAPGTRFRAIDLLMLDGLTNLTFLGSEPLGTQTAVFLRGSDYTCSNRYVLLVIGLPEVLSTVFKSCDSSLEMLPQADGVSLGFLNNQASPQYHYVYRDSELYGPIYDEPQHYESHYRHFFHHKDKKHHVQDNKAQSSDSNAAIDLDNLSVPNNTKAVNLDSLGK